jgi:hypothetical protein
MIAHIHDLRVEQNLPPTRDSGKDVYVRDNYMNAGFFVLAPPDTVFDYYLALLDQPGAFDPNYPEQNLLAVPTAMVGCRRGVSDSTRITKVWVQQSTRAG